MWYVVWLIFIFGLVYCLDDSIVVKTTNIKSNKVENEVRCVVLTDFHSNHSQEVLSKLRGLKFDAILICGDLIDERYDLSEVDKLLKGLPDCVKLFVSGNHEFKDKALMNHSELIEYLKGYNVECIDEQVVDMNINNQTIQFIGIKDHRSVEFEKRTEFDNEQASKLKKELDPKLFTICMMHRPERYDLFEDDSVDCMLSGHAHGGQARLGNLVNGLFAPDQGFFPKRAGGEYKLSHGLHVVSRGLSSYWYLPRFLNHREINMIIINPGKII